VAAKFRVGKVIKEGGRTIPLVGSRVAQDTFVPSRRVLTTAFGTSAGVSPLLTGAGIKAGIGAGKGVYREVNEEVQQDGPIFDESDAGGSQHPDQTRRNLEM
jgi:hypothetical protein